MTCTIRWNTLSLEEWEARFQAVRRSNLLQSHAYGRTMRDLRGQSPHWGVIEIGGAEAGLVQILEVKLFKGWMHGLMLDRGPLWFEGFGGPAHFESFLKEFSRQFPNRLGRTRRFIPEVEDSAVYKSLLAAHGWRPGKGKPYKTLWLDLARDEKTLRANLHKNWRNALSKAERSGISVEWDESEKHLPWLLAEYHFDKIERRYPGPGVDLIQALARHAAPAGGLLTGRAMAEDRPVAGILILLHGRGATYQIGWSSAEGRQANAHNLLLWQALERLRNKGIHDLDLGGINEDDGGIRKFKEGMGGALCVLPGLYR